VIYSRTLLERAVAEMEAAEFGDLDGQTRGFFSTDD
jgi:hypothetical protein